MSAITLAQTPIVTELDLDSIPVGGQHRVRVVMTENATGNETLVPVIAMRGAEPGPVVGITAAMHGNELNGISVVHKLVAALKKSTIKAGAVVAVPIINVPGYLRQQREFEDGVDLNRIMPGKPNGTESALYAHRFVDRVLSKFNYLIDLHTASFGRINSLYVRANMDNEQTAKLARLIAPQIIVNSKDNDGTLRGAAEKLGICALTVEVGDPQRFQKGMVRAARLGLQEVLESLGIIDDISDPEENSFVECIKSYWIYTDRGGMLRVLPGLCDEVKEGEVIARLVNIWGDQVREYRAPEDAVIVGKSVNPAARAGSRIAHLGIRAK